MADYGGDANTTTIGRGQGWGRAGAGLGQGGSRGGADLTQRGGVGHNGVGCDGVVATVWGAMEW